MTAGVFFFVPVEAVNPDDGFWGGVGVGKQMGVGEVGGGGEFCRPQAGLGGANGVVREIGVVRADVEVAEHVAHGGELHFKCDGEFEFVVVVDFQDEGFGGGDAAFAHEEDGALVPSPTREPGWVEWDSGGGDAVGGGGVGCFVAANAELGQTVGRVPGAEGVGEEGGVDDVEGFVLVLEFVGVWG